MADFLPIKKLSDLTVQEEYSVTDLRFVRTKYGKRVIIDVANEFTCFLPGRFVHLFEDDNGLFEQMIAAAHKNKLGMQYLGSEFNNLEFKQLTK